MSASKRGSWLGVNRMFLISDTTAPLAAESFSSTIFNNHVEDTGFTSKGLTFSLFPDASSTTGVVEVNAQYATETAPSTWIDLNESEYFGGTAPFILDTSDPDLLANGIEFGVNMTRYAYRLRFNVTTVMTAPTSAICVFNEQDTQFDFENKTSFGEE